MPKDNNPRTTINKRRPDDANWGREDPEVGTEAAEREIVAEISDADIAQRFKALDEAQETWEEVSYLANPKMPCPECGGAGAVGGGSLGDVCVRCMGARVVEQPGRQTVQQPPFAELRAALRAYGDALIDQRLPEGHRAKKGLALPAPETVPPLADLQQLTKDAINVSRQLAGAPGLADIKSLPEAKKAKGLAGEGDLGEYTDAELADMEDAAKKDRP